MRCLLQVHRDRRDARLREARAGRGGVEVARREGESGNQHCEKKKVAILSGMQTTADPPWWEIVHDAMPAMPRNAKGRTERSHFHPFSAAS